MIHSVACSALSSSNNRPYFCTTSPGFTSLGVAYFPPIEKVAPHNDFADFLSSKHLEQSLRQLSPLLLLLLVLLLLLLSSLSFPSSSFVSGTGGTGAGCGLSVTRVSALYFFSNRVNSSSSVSWTSTGTWDLSRRGTGSGCTGQFLTICPGLLHLKQTLSRHVLRLPLVLGRPPYPLPVIVCNNNEPHRNFMSV